MYLSPLVQICPNPWFNCVKVNLAVARCIVTNFVVLCVLKLRSGPQSIEYLDSEAETVASLTW